MKKLPLSEFEYASFLDDHTSFSEDDLISILECTRVAIRSGEVSVHQASIDLSFAAHLLKYQRHNELHPEEATVLKTLAEIRDHAEALRRILRIVDENGLNGAGVEPRVIGGVDWLLSDWMSSVLRKRLSKRLGERGHLHALSHLKPDSAGSGALLMLAELLEVLRTAAEARLNTPRLVPHRFPFPPPLEHFAANSAMVYLRFTGRATLSFSRNPVTREVGGPLIRFVEACCSHIGEEVRRETLARWIQNWRKDWHKG